LAGRIALLFVRRFTVAALPDVKPKTVVILGFDGVSALDLSGPLEAFTIARINVSGGKTNRCYTPTIIGVTWKSFTTESGLVLAGHDILRKISAVDTLVIPGGSGIRTRDVGRAVAEWLVAHTPRLRRIIAVGAGIYPLAQSGLLDGRRVTTHWKFAQDVARRFPTLRVDQTIAAAKDGAFYTCGGGTSAVEMVLGLIEEDYGKGIALSVARELVLRLRPIADQESSINVFNFDYGPADRLADLPAWISSHLDENLSVEALAERACLCSRHFRRLFKKTFEITPAAFVERVRIAEAGRRLLLPQINIESVAAAVGFKNSDSFRRAFERRLSVSPSAYRRNFKGRRAETRPSGLFAA
jgi:transcriptional regulator GlxA family with amidase domain